MVLVFTLAAGCDIIPKMSEEVAASEEDHAQETALFETAVAKVKTEAAPPTATVTETAPPTKTPGTPFILSPSFITPKPNISSTPKILPTSEDPWLLTNWCLAHLACERMEVKNQSDYWIGMFLRFNETGVSKLFSIPPKGHAWITLRPGSYYYQVTTCGGANVLEGYHNLSGSWYWLQKARYCD